MQHINDEESKKLLEELQNKIGSPHLWNAQKATVGGKDRSKPIVSNQKKPIQNLR